MREKILKTRFYLTDDSCNPIDIESLDIVSCNEDHLLCNNWTYESWNDAIEALIVQLEFMKRE